MGHTITTTVSKNTHSSTHSQKSSKIIKKTVVKIEKPNKPPKPKIAPKPKVIPKFKQNVNKSSQYQSSSTVESREETETVNEEVEKEQDQVYVTKAVATTRIEHFNKLINESSSRTIVISSNFVDKNAETNETETKQAEVDMSTRDLKEEIQQEVLPKEEKEELIEEEPSQELDEIFDLINRKNEPQTDEEDKNDKDEEPPPIAKVRSSIAILDLNSENEKIVPKPRKSKPSSTSSSKDQEQDQQDKVPDQQPPNQPKVLSPFHQNDENSLATNNIDDSSSLRTESQLPSHDLTNLVDSPELRKFPIRKKIELTNSIDSSSNVIVSGINEGNNDGNTKPKNPQSSITTTTSNSVFSASGLTSSSSENTHPHKFSKNSILNNNSLLNFDSTKPMPTLGTVLAQIEASPREIESYNPIEPQDTSKSDFTTLRRNSSGGSIALLTAKPFSHGPVLQTHRTVPTDLMPRKVLPQIPNIENVAVEPNNPPIPPPRNGSSATVVLQSPPDPIVQLPGPPLYSSSVSSSHDNTTVRNLDNISEQDERLSESTSVLNTPPVPPPRSRAGTEERTIDNSNTYNTEATERIIEKIEKSEIQRMSEEDFHPPTILSQSEIFKELRTTESNYLKKLAFLKNHVEPLLRPALDSVCKKYKSFVKVRNNLEAIFGVVSKGPKNLFFTEYYFFLLIISSFT